MASIKENTTISEYQNFVNEVYGLSNGRHFSAWDMLTNIERFIMRGLKGIRKNDNAKTKINLLISLSWFMSLMNQLHIEIEKEVWKRFPYQCSYCGSCPCLCKKKKVRARRKLLISKKRRPYALVDFQEMFEKIYPSKSRSVEDAGIHLAEEIGELAEAILAYRGNHRENDFKNIRLEAADLFSCIMAVFNSLNVNVIKELSILFSNNCHVCNRMPCTCSFDAVMRYES